MPWNRIVKFVCFSVDLVNWLPRDARVGQAIVYYNIAAIYAITNDVEKAFKYFNLVRWIDRDESKEIPFFSIF